MHVGNISTIFFFISHVIIFFVNRNKDNNLREYFVHVNLVTAVVGIFSFFPQSHAHVVERGQT